MSEHDWQSSSIRPGSEGPGAVHRHGRLEEERPHQPVGPEEGELVVRGRGPLHVVAGRAQPLEQEDHQGGELDRHEGCDHPGRDAEWLWKEKIKSNLNPNNNENSGG